MNPLLKRLNLWHAVALLLLAVPVMVVFGFGVFFLWQHPQRYVWLGALALVMALGWGLQLLLRKRNQHLLAAAVTRPDPAWLPSAEEAWRQVEADADALDPADWPLGDGSNLLALGRRTLERVARHYHPEQERPLLELTVPHTLMIIERACHDLRSDILECVPFSHRLTMGDLVRARRWQASAEKVFDVYRAGRMIINPVDGVLGEIKRHLLGEGFGIARTDLHRWLLGAYVRKVGRYAIDLYSGQLPVQDDGPLTRTTTPSRQAQQSAEIRTDTDDEEPLRIVIAGRCNAGKSSLINALFGHLSSATDVLADTTRVATPYRLERDGMLRALVFDTPGFDGERFDPAEFDALVQQADLILWVVPANRPDRSLEHIRITHLRKAFATGRPVPPIIVCASHVDQLRPLRQWDPPYDLDDPHQPKAVSIRAAIEAIAADLGLPVASVVPVCLLPGRIYNVDDALWAAMLDRQDEMLKLRLLRCLDARRREQNWGLVWTQLRGAGRWLGKRLSRT